MAHEWAGSSNNWVKIDYECDFIRSGSWTWDLLKSGGQNLVELKIELQSGAQIRAGSIQTFVKTMNVAVGGARGSGGGLPKAKGWW